MSVPRSSRAMAMGALCAAVLLMQCSVVWSQRSRSGEGKVALVLRGVSTPTSLGLEKRLTAGWRETHSELTRWFVEPLEADVFLHTWAGAEASAVVAAYRPVASSVEERIDFEASYRALVLGRCNSSESESSGHRCGPVLQAKMSSFWSLRAAAQLIEAHEAARGARYDWIANTRFDVKLDFCASASHVPLLQCAGDGVAGSPLQLNATAAKEAGDMVWGFAHPPQGAPRPRAFRGALRSNVARNTATLESNAART